MEQLAEVKTGDVGGEHQVHHLLHLESSAEVGGELGLVGLEGSSEASEEQELPHQLLRQTQVLHLDRRRRRSKMGEDQRSGMAVGEEEEEERTWWRTAE